MHSRGQHADLSKAFVPGRAGDLMPHCRQVCCGHRGKLAPVCVFGNILDSCPPGKKLAVRRALNDCQVLGRLSQEVESNGSTAVRVNSRILCGQVDRRNAPGAPSPGVAGVR